jgi:hypothetical protein
MTRNPRVTSSTTDVLEYKNKMPFLCAHVGTSMHTAVLPFKVSYFHKVYGTFFFKHSVSVTFTSLSHSKAAANCDCNNCSSSKYDIFFKAVNFTTVMELLRLLGLGTLIFVTLLLAPVYTVKSDR